MDAGPEETRVKERSEAGCRSALHEDEGVEKKNRCVVK